MTTNAQTQSSEEKKTYTEMPPIEEFRSLDSATQRDLMSRFPDTQDQEEEKSETSQEESQEKTEESSDDQTEKKDDDDSASKTEDKQKEEAKDEDPALVKNYKELQAEFTRRSQKMKQLEAEIAEIKAQANKGKDSEVKSPLAKLVEANPNAKDLVSAIEEEVQFRLKEGLDKGIRPIQEKLTQRTADENYGKFQSEVKEFLDSPLGKLNTELNQVAAELYGNQETLLEQASKDPALFTNLKKEVLSRHFIKAAELMGKVVSPESKSKAVKDTGISGKSKTTTVVDDELDMKVFKGKTSEEMKKILDKHGAVKHS